MNLKHKAHFLGTPSYTRLGPKHIILLEELKFNYRKDGEDPIIVPEGYVSDGPSVPPAPVFLLISILFGLFSYYVRQDHFLIVLLLTLLPIFLRWYIRPSLFFYSGLVHDEIRNSWSTGNFATDGILLSAVKAEGNSHLQGFLIFLGVRIGTWTGFKSVIPEKVQKEAVRIYACKKKMPVEDCFFDTHSNQVRIKEK